GELLIGVAALERCRGANSIRTPVASARQRCKSIRGIDVRDELVEIADTLRVENLPSLNTIVAEAKINGRRAEHIIEHDKVVALDGVQRQPFDVAIVEAFHMRGGAGDVEQGDKTSIGMERRVLRGNSGFDR